MRKLILLSLILCVSWAVNSQNRFGVFGGLNISNIYNEENDFEDHPYFARSGFNFGFAWEHTFKEKVGIQSELQYSLAGARSGSPKQNFSLHYVAVPITFCYKPIDKLKFYVGPQLMFLIKSEPFFDDLDYGVLSGIEYQPFSQWSVSIRNYFGLHYNFNYSDLPSSPGGTPLNLDFEMHRNNIFQVSFQCYFSE